MQVITIPKDHDKIMADFPKERKLKWKMKSSPKAEIISLVQRY